MPKHPREVKLEKMLEELDRDPHKAAELLKRMSVIMARPRTDGNPYQYPEALAKALKMGAMALEREAKEDEESFYPKVLRMLDDATIAQLDSFAEYAKQRAVIKRTEELQRGMKKWKEEKEKEDGNA